MKNFWMMLVVAGLCLSACGRQDTKLQDSWIGKWTGPEGTSLLISHDTQKHRYLVSIQSLDYLRTYIARAKDDTLVFKREGEKSTITAGDGQATGMKWLADKRDCLIIRSGQQAFCRK